MRHRLGRVHLRDVRDAEVADLHVHVLGDEDVRRLDVAMDHRLA